AFQVGLQVLVAGSADGLDLLALARRARLIGRGIAIEVERAADAAAHRAGIVLATELGIDRAFATLAAREERIVVGGLAFVGFRAGLAGGFVPGEDGAA